MAGGFLPICPGDTNGHTIALYVEDDLDYSKPVRIALLDAKRKPVAQSCVLNNVEIGDLCAKLQRIYLKRTGRVVWPYSGTLTKRFYDKALIDADKCADIAARQKELHTTKEWLLSIQCRPNVDELAKAADALEIDDDPLGLEDDTTPRTRYFVHPESDSYFTTEDGSYPGTDGCVEEVDKETYDKFVLDVASADDPLSDEDDEI